MISRRKNNIPVSREIKVLEIQGNWKEPALTSSLDVTKYNIIKAAVWLRLLEDSMIPVKWLKAKSTGTNIYVNFSKRQEDWNKSFQELSEFVEGIQGKSF